MKNHYWTLLAESAYLSYGATTDFKNFRGEPMPDFRALPDTIREAWEAAAKSTYGQGYRDGYGDADNGREPVFDGRPDPMIDAYRAHLKATRDAGVAPMEPNAFVLTWKQTTPAQAHEAQTLYEVFKVASQEAGAPTQGADSQEGIW